MKFCNCRLILDIYSQGLLINIRACKNFAVYRPRKDILFKTKIDTSIPRLRQKMINSIPCLRQKSLKHTLASRTSPLSPYKGVPLPGSEDKGIGSLRNLM